MDAAHREASAEDRPVRVDEAEHPQRGYLRMRSAGDVRDQSNLLEDSVDQLGAVAATHQQPLDAWPQDVQEAVRTAVKEAIPVQRDLAVQEEIDARKAIEVEGCEVADLTAAERKVFQDAVQPIYAEVRRQFGDALIDGLGLK